MTDATRKALIQVGKDHPEFAAMLAGRLDPQPVSLKHRVRRTPTTGKFLRTG